MVNSKALNSINQLRQSIIELGLQGYSVADFKMGKDKPVIVIDRSYHEITGSKNGWEYCDSNSVITWRKE